MIGAFWFAYRLLREQSPRLSAFAVSMLLCAMVGLAAVHGIEMAAHWAAAVLATVEETNNVDDELTRRLVDLVGDEGPLLEGARAHTRSEVVARSASERETRLSAWSRIVDTKRRAISVDAAGDPIVELIELPLGFGSEFDRPVMNGQPTCPRSCLAHPR